MTGRIDGNPFLGAAYKPAETRISEGPGYAEITAAVLVRTPGNSPVGRDETGDFRQDLRAKNRGFCYLEI
jgi:hypothetical protein